MVKTTLVPDPDIPEDVNIIDFPIDPRKTKNGTLDGMVGFKPDPELPVRRHRARKLLPARRGLRPAARDRAPGQAARGLLPAVRHREPHPGQQVRDHRQRCEITNGFTEFRDETLTAEPAYDWKQRLAKRSLVNTYVWTASGGLHTEQSQLVDTYTESYTGSTRTSPAPARTSRSISPRFVGVAAEFDALFATTLEIESIKNAQTESSFGLEVAFSPERYLKRPVLDADGKPIGFTEEDAPGKVDGYRFMSFYIAPSEDNFGRFTDIVDQNWLQKARRRTPPRCERRPTRRTARGGFCTASPS